MVFALRLSFAYASLGDKQWQPNLTGHLAETNNSVTYASCRKNVQFGPDLSEIDA